jgi:hypothetical protein
MAQQRLFPTNKTSQLQDFAQASTKATKSASQIPVQTTKRMAPKLRTGTVTALFEELVMPSSSRDAVTTPVDSCDMVQAGVDLDPIQWSEH